MTLRTRVHAVCTIASLTCCLLAGCDRSSDTTCSDAGTQCSSDPAPDASIAELSSAALGEGCSEDSHCKAGLRCDRSACVIASASRCSLPDRKMCFEGEWDTAWQAMCESQDGQVVADCPSDNIGRCEYEARNGLTVLVKFYAPATEDDAREMCLLSSGTYSSG